MTIGIDSMKANIKRWILILGVLQITVGCVVGFIPPSAVAWFRGIVMAHIEFTANGVLMVAFGFLVMELRLSPAVLKLWFAMLQIGTWANGAAGLAAAFIGASSKLMPTINEKFPPPGGTDNAIVSGSLKLTGLTIMVALLLTLYGLLRPKTSGDDSKPNPCVEENVPREHWHRWLVFVEIECFNSHAAYRPTFSDRYRSGTFAGPA